MAKPSGGGFRKIAMQWAFLIALGVVAIAYFVMPSRAAVRPAWSAELGALEEGEGLAAAVDSAPPGEAMIDGNRATHLDAGDPLTEALEAGAEVSVIMTGGGMPENAFSLAGSAAAIRDVCAACR